jgi:hypothetical protein
MDGNGVLLLIVIVGALVLTVVLVVRLVRVLRLVKNPEGDDDILPSSRPDHHPSLPRLPARADPPRRYLDEDVENAKAFSGLFTCQKCGHTQRDHDAHGRCWTAGCECTGFVEEQP